MLGLNWCVVSSLLVLGLLYPKSSNMLILVLSAVVSWPLLASSTGRCQNHNSIFNWIADWRPVSGRGKVCPFKLILLLFSPWIVGFHPQNAIVAQFSGGCGRLIAHIGSAADCSVQQEIHDVRNTAIFVGMVNRSICLEPSFLSAKHHKSLNCYLKYRGLHLFPENVII